MQKSCQCTSSGYCLLLKRPSCDPPEGRWMSEVRWAECHNEDGKHEAWFPMFLGEAENDRCPSRKRPQQTDAFSQQNRTKIEEEIGKGPGTDLILILAGWFWRILGIRIKTSCKCLSHAREMNRNGIEWCNNNVRVIVGWLKEQHKAQEIVIPFSETVAVLLIQKAIKRARKYKRAGKR